MLPLIRRFVAGETAEEALRAVGGLNARGLKATLDLLGEETRSKDQAAEAARAIAALFDRIAETRADCNVSLKLTQLGLNLSEGVARDNLLRVLETAERRGNFVRIDMEGSAYTQRTLDIFFEAFERHKGVGVVIQAMLRRSASDVEALIRAGARVRLCKGAYKEPPAAAFQSRAEIDANYDRLATELVTRGNFPGLATHDDARIRAAQAAAAAAGIGKDRFEFQMLYGVRPRRWDELAGQGYGLRVYVPYGRDWLPYYYRRIRERKENLLFAVRSVFSS